jgi:predicted protein tyrosine phosphatase
MIEFEILSRKKAQRRRPQKPHLLISITDAGSSHPKFPRNPWRKKTVRLKFDDIKRTRPGYVAFSEKDALKILKAMLENINVPLVLVHCEAGISRSSATAAALSVIFNIHELDVWDHPDYSPNKRVYKGILRTWNKMVRRATAK